MGLELTGRSLVSKCCLTESCHFLNVAGEAVKKARCHSMLQAGLELFRSYRNRNGQRCCSGVRIEASSMSSFERCVSSGFGPK